MTQNEYQEKLKKLETRKNTLFKKITKCNKDIRKTQEEWMIAQTTFRKGQKYIISNSKGEVEYLRVKSIKPITSHILGFEITFTRLNSNWVCPRRWDWCKEWVITYCNDATNHGMPGDWKWEKVEDGSAGKEK